MSAAVPDEYQDRASAGSLVKARGHWLDLMDADRLHLPQQFTFVFHAPTLRMAVGLTDFLRYGPDVGFVRTTDHAGYPQPGLWQVAGTTRSRLWSLPTLEHLFMHLRRAGSRYQAVLVSLELLPMSRWVG